MDSTGGALDFEVILRNQAQFMSQLKSIEDGIRNVGGTAKRQGEEIEGAFSKAGKAVAAYFSLQAMEGFGSKLIETRGQFQQLDIAFSTMLGNKEKANALMGQVVDLAAKTPFTLEQVAGGAKQLLAYQVSSDKVIDTLTRLGNVASGVSVPVDRLILAYGQVKAKGKLDGEDLRQFTEAGVPMIHEIAKAMGVADQQVAKLVESGKVGFPEVQKAIQNLTNEGGMFYNMMEAQSKSLSGMVSNLSDAWDKALNDFGAKNQDILSGGINLATEIVTHFQDIVDILKVIVATYGAYKAAVIATSVAQSAMTAVGNISAWLELAKGIRTAKDAQIALNLATKANPIGLILGVVALAATTYMTFAKSATAAEMAQADLEKRHDSMNNSLNRQAMEYKALASTVEKTKPGTDERKKAVSELTAKYGDLLPKIDLINASEKDFAAAVREGNTELNKRQKLNSTLGQLQSATSDYLISKETERRLSRQYQSAKNDPNKSNFQISTAFDELSQAIEDRKAKEIVYNKLKSEFNALKGGSSTDAKTDPFAGLVKYSEEYWKVVVKQAEDARAKIADDSPKGKSAIAKYTKTIEDAQKHIDAITNKKQKDPSKQFDEKLKKVKEQYDLYYQWVNSPDTDIQQAADKQFENLLKKGQSYADYLQQLKDSYDKTPIEKRTKEQQSEYQKITAALQQELSGESPFDTFKKKLEQSKKDAQSLSEYLEIIKQYQGTYKGDMSQQGININKYLQEQRNATESQIYDNASQLIEQYKSYIDQKDALDKAYENDVKLINDRILIAEKAGDEESIKSAKNALQGRMQKYGEDLDSAKGEAFEKTDLYKKLYEYVNSNERQNLVDHIKYLQEALASDNLSIQQRKQLERDLYQTKKELRAKDLETFNKISGSIGEIGGQLEGLTGVLGSIGSALTGIASQAKNISTAFDDNATTLDKVSSGVQGIVTLVNIVASSAQQRRQAMEEYYNSIIAQQDEYNLLLNEEIRLQSEKEGNIFVTDYYGKIKDSFDAMSDATLKYNVALEKLNEGQVKIGKRDAVDWKSVGTGASAGAAAGAAVGSVVPVIGTAIGAAVGGVVGAITGIFGGKKKKDKWGDLLTEYPELIQTAADGQETLNTKLAQTLIDQNLVNDATKENLKNAIDLQKAYDEAKQQLEDTLKTLTDNLGDNLSSALVSAFENGTDAGEAMFGALNNSLDNFISQMAYAATFGSDLTQLQKDMEESLNGGDGSVIDDFAKFYQAAAKDAVTYDTILQSAKDVSKQYGFDLFQSESSDSNSLSGSIQGASEETVSIVAGQVTAIRMTMADMLNSVRQGLVYQYEIMVNTAYNKHLESIDKKLDALQNDTLRAKGLG